MSFFTNLCIAVALFIVENTDGDYSDMVMYTTN